MKRAVTKKRMDTSWFTISPMIILDRGSLLGLLIGPIVSSLSEHEYIIITILLPEYAIFFPAHGKGW